MAVFLVHACLCFKYARFYNYEVMCRLDYLCMDKQYCTVHSDKHIILQILLLNILTSVGML